MTSVRERQHLPPETADADVFAAVGSSFTKVCELEGRPGLLLTEIITEPVPDRPQIDLAPWSTNSTPVARRGRKATGLRSPSQPGRRMEPHRMFWHGSRWIRPARMVGLDRKRFKAADARTFSPVIAICPAGSINSFGPHGFF